MPPRRGSRRGVAEPKGQIDRIERILEELVQVVQDTRSNTANAPEPPVVPWQLTVLVPRVEVVNCTTIK